MRILLAPAFAALLLGGAALADEPGLRPLKPVQPVSERSLDEVMRSLPQCTAFTNECEICRRAPEGAQCSTPGLACQPKQWRCDAATPQPRGI